MTKKNYLIKFLKLYLVRCYRVLPYYFDDEKGKCITNLVKKCKVW